MGIEHCTVCDVGYEGETLTKGLCEACVEQREQDEAFAEYEAASSQVKALADHLACDVQDVEESRHGGEGAHRAHGKDFLVLTDDEADDACRARILDSLWAFNADFIASHVRPRLNDAATKALAKTQGELCEDANDLVRAIIHDIDAFVADAVRSDGRGHFVSSYDGEEHEVRVGDDFFYLYRQ